jgi:hypothetical protein
VTLRRMGFLFLIAFALFGFGELVVQLDAHYRVPPAFANPFSFLILEIRSPDEPAKVCGRIYLSGASDPSEVHFEGEHLVHKESKLPYFQSSVPFNGFIVSGSGRVIFGKAIIGIDGDSFTLNGAEAHPLDFTVGRNGTYRVGLIRIAH